MENSTSGPPILKKYLLVYKTNPRSRVFAPLAETYRKMGFQNKAMAILKDGIKHNPNYPMGYLGLSQCYYDQEQFELAYTTLRPLISSNRDNIRMQKLFGQICMSLENYEEALDTYKYLLFINPKDFEVQEKVKNLEDNYLNKNSFFLGPSVQNPDGGSDQLFSVENLSILPSGESDEWSALDLTSSKKTPNQEGEVKENWEMVAGAHNELNEEKSISNQGPQDGPKPTDQSSLETLTLVDVYISQGHKKKALEILNRILAKNPNHDLALEKRAKLEKEYDSQGQKDLMDFYDKKMGLKKDGNYQEIERRMGRFLELLRGKALKKGAFK